MKSVQHFWSCLQVNMWRACCTHCSTLLLLCFHIAWNHTVKSPGHSNYMCVFRWTCCTHVVWYRCVCSDGLSMPHALWCKCVRLDRLAVQHAVWCVCVQVVCLCHLLYNCKCVFRRSVCTTCFVTKCMCTDGSFVPHAVSVCIQICTACCINVSVCSCGHCTSCYVYVLVDTVPLAMCMFL